MAEENTSQEFTLKNIVEKRKYFVGEIAQNEFMSKRHKSFFTTLNYIQHFRILAFPVAGCIYISYIASLVGIPIGIIN